MAVYTFSRNLSRTAPLTQDRNEAITGLRKAVAGDAAALYNTLLLTVRDAAKVPGGKVEAFESTREDLGNSYIITYYPAPNPNEGFRKIAVEITSDPGKRYRVRARPGYRPRGGF